LIQALVSVYFFLVFRREAKVVGKNPWAWALVGASCFFICSTLTTVVLSRTAVFLWGSRMGEDVVLLVFAAVGLGLVLGFLLTNVVKGKYLKGT
jgi:hypothetical protein